MPSKYSRSNCITWRDGAVTYKLYKNEADFQLHRIVEPVGHSWILIPFEVAREIGNELISVPGSGIAET